MNVQTPVPPDLLQAIVAATKRIVEVRAASEPLAAVERRAAAVTPRPGTFRAALARPNRLNIIAECKRRSPSRGVLSENYDPAAIARAYDRGGAAAISVLTEPTFFDGAIDDLRVVREASRLPLLRKDFIVARYQIFEARAAGADAVLLIVAALAEADLRMLQTAACEAGLDVLVEVHDRRELEIALGVGATLVGVNNRDLRTLAVETQTGERMIEAIPPTVVAVAESGLRTAGDLLRLRRAGFHAFLVGERLMTSPDPAQALHELLREAAVGSSDGVQRLATKD